MLILILYYLLIVIGEAYFKIGQFVDAEHWYREALRVKPDHIPAHLTYAKLLSKWVCLNFHKFK